MPVSINWESFRPYRKSPTNLGFIFRLLIFGSSHILEPYLSLSKGFPRGLVLGRFVLVGCVLWAPILNMVRTWYVLGSKLEAQIRGP